MKIILFAFLSLLMTVDGYESYKNHKLYEVLPDVINYEDFAAWEDLEGIDFFKLRSHNQVSTVLVAPDQQTAFEDFLVRHNIIHNIIFADYGIEIEKERQEMAETRKHKSAFNAQGTADFSVYWSFAEMQTYLVNLRSRYQTVQLEIIGNSPEGHPIYAVKISSNSVFGQKPIIALDTGMHAREWATPPTSFYLIHKLVEDPKTSAELLSKVDWLIIPMLNPDGYEHSRNSFRLWRKNRRNVTASCVGVDLNRNFAFSWRPATITQICSSSTFPGHSAHSEPEVSQLNSIIARYAKNIKMYITVHSFGDLVLYPWGFSSPSAPIKNTDELIKVGNLWRNAILSATRTNYVVINSFDHFGNIQGGVHDHMVGTHGVPLVYALELTNGFDFRFPESRIMELVQETLFGYRVFAQYVGENYS